MSTHALIPPTAHTERGIEQVDWQLPATQNDSAAQAFPQAPQWPLLLCVSTHAPPHIVCPAGQAHAPATHTRPPAHPLLHAPQWLLLLRVSTQPAIAPHAVSPGAHTPASTTTSGAASSAASAAASWEASGAIASIIVAPPLSSLASGDDIEPSSLASSAASIGAAPSSRASGDAATSGFGDASRPASDCAASGLESSDSTGDAHPTAANSDNKQPTGYFIATLLRTIATTSIEACARDP